MATNNCECAADPASLTLIQGPYYGIDLKKIKAEILAELAGSGGTGGGTGDGIVADLQIGKETKMPMRMHGKQVYGTLMDFGALPNATIKKVAHGLTDFDWIHVSQEFSRVTENVEGTYSPVNWPSTSAAYSWGTFISKGYVNISTSANRSAFKAIICLIYTKESETAVI